MQPVKVLIVDDSPTMRAVIRDHLQESRSIEVVGEAGDAFEAREAIKRLSPDVITLDVEMPRMNGLDFLEKLMRLRPMPVVMVSSLTQEGASATIDALALGAIDYVSKPTSGSTGVGYGELVDKVLTAARSQVGKARPSAAIRSRPQEYRFRDKIVAIGSSTGGVEALLAIISEFPENCPPTVITQHMPKHFTNSFAARLDAACAPRVVEATHGMPLEAGMVVIAPGGENHIYVDCGQTTRIMLKPGAPVSGHRPSVDVMFQSLEPVARKVVGVILTGMGRDGADGLLTLRNSGARTIGQDEKSSIVYGMPRAAHEIGAVENQLPLRKIASKIFELASESQKVSA